MAFHLFSTKQFSKPMLSFSEQESEQETSANYIIIVQTISRKQMEMGMLCITGYHVSDRVSWVTGSKTHGADMALMHGFCL